MAKIGPKARMDLLRYVFDDGRLALPALRHEVARWADDRAAFAAFLNAHRDKIRKKLRTAADEDAVADVRAELLVAHRLLADRRFDVAFEAYGAGRRGPDLTVTFRTVERFNVEVTRLRIASRLAEALLAKVRQLPAGVPNVVAVVRGEGAPLDVGEAMRRVRVDADAKTYRRLSGVAVVPDGDASGVLWMGPEARIPLSRGSARAVSRCLLEPTG